MATFMEAMKAARAGKKVALIGNYDSYEYEWRNGGLITKEGKDVHIRHAFLDGHWIIIQEPPREYTFMEAVEMMEKSGKSFTPKGTSPGFIYIDLAEYEYKQRINSTGQGYYSTKFKHDRGGHGKIQEIEDWRPSISDIKGKWIEVKP